MPPKAVLARGSRFEDIMHFHPLRQPLSLLIVAILAIAPSASAGDSSESGVRWGALARQSALFLGVQHGFRLATEPGTREGMKGSFFDGWGESVTSLHGWEDGDPFLVNYVGHPMQGAVASYIWIQNDSRYQRARFGSNPHYWKSRLRATAFSWAYSTQFELGPLSEASLGKIQRTSRQQGLVDHVVTPTIGLAWTIGEDFLDERVILPLERRTSNPILRDLLRGGLNPSRSFANAMRMKKPWHRDTREEGLTLPASTPSVERTRPLFQFASTSNYGRFIGGGGQEPTNCIGGSGQAEFSLSESTSLLAEAGGCKVFDGKAGESTDVLQFQGGVRYYPTNGSRWNPYVEVLTGLQRVTIDRDYGPAIGVPVMTSQVDGFTLAAGGGVEMVLWRPLAIRLAQVRVSHVWAPSDPGLGRTAVWVSSGLTLRFGTW